MGLMGYVFSLTCRDAHLKTKFNFQLHHHHPSDQKPAAGGQRNVLVQDELGADFASEPKCGLGGHIQQLPKNIGVTLGARQQSQQKTPDDEHQRKFNQTFGNDNGKQHKTLLMQIKKTFWIL
ncbi:hypothetical protein [Limnohabitans sp.]|uniref:hypothetical protein n=1 Tax=Limnohabitans sp. TaxID=1907725 RepID=UPI0037BF2717